MFLILKILSVFFVGYAVMVAYPKVSEKRSLMKVPFGSGEERNILMQMAYNVFMGIFILLFVLTVNFVFSH